MNNIAFIICCKDSKYIHKCIDSISVYYPNSHAYIIDSASEDKSYFDLQNKYNFVTIFDVNNLNYEYGAYLYWYNHYDSSKYDTLIFIQDGISFNSKIEELDLLSNDEVLVFQHNGSGWDWEQEGKKSFFLLSPEFPDIEYVFPTAFPMALWNSFIIKSSTFKKIVDSTLFKAAAKPDTKRLSCAWERVWAIIFHKNQLTIKSIDTNQITKTFGGRE